MAPLIASYSPNFPAGHVMQVDAHPIEYLPAGQAMRLVRSGAGLKPAGVDLQDEALLLSLYCPGPLHCLHVRPSSEYIGAAHEAQIV